MKSIIIAHKYGVGETVWLVVKPQFLHNSTCIPIFECEVVGVRVSTHLNPGRELEQHTVRYELLSVDSLLDEFNEPEDQVLPTKEEALSKALNILESSIDKLTETVGERRLALCETLREFKTLEEESS